MEEALIEAVRSEKCLYDLKHPDYVKIRLKDTIWQRIAETLIFKDGNEAKKTWEKLRNNHRDALRRQKNSKQKYESSGNVSIKQWRFQDNMAFLIPHMTNRLTGDACHDMQEEISEPHSETEGEIDIQEHFLERQETHTDNEETTVPEPDLPSPDVPTDRVKKRRRHTRDTLNDLLNRSIKDHQHRVINGQRKREHLSNNDFICNNVKNDPLFHFFISMYETTKRLRPESQFAIKTNIFSLVSSEESKNIEQYVPRPNSNNTNSDAETNSS